MGCLLSQNNSEAVTLISTLSLLNEEKSESLYNLNNLKISRHLSSKPLDLKLQNDSQITKEYLDSRISELSSSLATIKLIRKPDDPDFLSVFSDLDNLLKHPFYEEMKLTLKSSQIRVKTLNSKIKEIEYIKQDLDQQNLTLEDLEQRRQSIEQEIQILKLQALRFKENVVELKEYLESLKRRKRRFTVSTLPHNKSQLRSKYLIKQEMLKKIENVKIDQAKFLQRIEEKRDRLQDSSEVNETMTPRYNYAPLSFNDVEYQNLTDAKKMINAERRGTLMPRISKG